MAAAADQGGGAIGDARKIDVGTFGGAATPMMVDDAAEASLGRRGPPEPSLLDSLRGSPHAPSPSFGPAFAADQSSQNSLTTLDFLAGNDFGEVKLADALSMSKNRSSDPCTTSRRSRAEISAIDPPG